MIKYFFLFLILLLTVQPAVSETFVTLPEQCDGSMMPYDFARVDTTFKAPDSLRAVYVSYVARHGARFMSKPDKAAKLEKMLYQMGMSRTINKRGENFLHLLADLNKRTAGQWGALSPVGVREENLLADEMCRVFPGLMSAGEIEAEATYVPRVVMSMYTFCHALDRHSGDLMIYSSSGKQYNDILRFFSTDSAYNSYRQQGDWREIYDKFVEENVPTDPALRIFGPAHKPEKLRELTMDIYSILQSLRAAGLPGPTTEWMSEDEYRRCWEADNLEHYLRNTINPLSTSACASRSLLSCIITDADEQLKERAINASLFFGHAETLMPLFSLMKLPGCFALPHDWTQLPSQWCDFDIVPLGANLLLGFYEAPSGAIYVTVRLNGRYVEPMKGKGKIIGWPTLRDYWLRLADDLNFLSSGEV